MNLNLKRPKNETEDLLLSINKSVKRSFKKTHRKAEEASEFSLIRQREKFHYIPPMTVDGPWMLGLVLQFDF